jgi:hypothetical protein
VKERRHDPGPVAIDMMPNDVVENILSSSLSIKGDKGQELLPFLRRGRGCLQKKRPESPSQPNS